MQALASTMLPPPGMRAEPACQAGSAARTTWPHHPGLHTTWRPAHSSAAGGGQAASQGQTLPACMLRRLSAVAGSPELYPELVRLGGVPPILALLSHDNGDIAAAAVELLREMTDADAVEDSVRAGYMASDRSPRCWQVLDDSHVAGTHAWALRRALAGTLACCVGHYACFLGNVQSVVESCTDLRRPQQKAHDLTLHLHKRHALKRCGGWLRAGRVVFLRGDF